MQSEEQPDMDAAEAVEDDGSSSNDAEVTNEASPPSRVEALFQARLQGQGGTSTVGFAQRPGPSHAVEDEAGVSDAREWP